jgi:hypothetical protein
LDWLVPDSPRQLRQDTEDKGQPLSRHGAPTWHPNGAQAGADLAEAPSNRPVNGHAAVRTVAKDRLVPTHYDTSDASNDAVWVALDISRSAKDSSARAAPLYTAPGAHCPTETCVHLPQAQLASSHFQREYGTQKGSCASRQNRASTYLLAVHCSRVLA